MRFKIYIAHHKPGFFYKSNIFEPIQVGRALSNIYLPMIGDDTGDNISHLNPWYCELTALYWIWKNVVDLDYVGLFHYRRSLTFSTNYTKTIGNELNYILKSTYSLINSKRNFNENHRIMNVSQAEFINNAKKDELILEKKINQFDCFLPKPVRNINKNIAVRFSEEHGNDAWSITTEVLSQNYPQMLETFLNMSNGKSLYAYNMFVMRMDLFDKFMNLQMKILSEISVRLDLNDKKNLRLLGFIAERIGGSFFLENQNKYKIKEMNIMGGYA